MTRHASVHAAGVVIAPRPLTEFVPLYRSQKDDGEITTQWAMKEIERVGLLKMDFLGLSTLTLLDDAVKHIEETTGDDIDLEQLPLDDAKTYQIFQNGQTHGVFQFESSGMRDTLRKAKPQCLEDLIALNALYRPGPLRGGVVDDYIARKHGRVEIKYDLPQMEPVLKETYGVIAYQEQVMRLASELAGFTLGQADELRRAMGKKDAAKMQAQRDALHERLHERRHLREEGDEDLRVHRVLRRLRLQQVALDDLRAARVSDGVSQGELPAPLHGGAADDRIAELRQDRAVPGRVPRAGRAGAAAGHQRQRARSSSSQPDGVRFGLGAVKGAGEGAIQSDPRRRARRSAAGSRRSSSWSSTSTCGS